MGRSEPGFIASGGSGLLSAPLGLQSTVDPDAGLPRLQEIAPICVDSDHGLHPFSVNRFDAGPVHAFNYRVAVFRDGAKAAVRTTLSWRAERGFLTDVSLPWGQQVAVIFQIVCALVLDVPAAACLTKFHQMWYCPLSHGVMMTI